MHDASQLATYPCSSSLASCHVWRRASSSTLCLFGFGRWQMAVQLVLALRAQLCVSLSPGWSRLASKQLPLYSYVWPYHGALSAHTMWVAAGRCMCTLCTFVCVVRSPERTHSGWVGAVGA
jgi:hypothetical protein